MCAFDNQIGMHSEFITNFDLWNLPKTSNYCKSRWLEVTRKISTLHPLV